MAITSAFQADDAGSIPAARSKQQRSRSMSGFFVSIKKQFVLFPPNK